MVVGADSRLGRRRLLLLAALAVAVVIGYFATQGLTNAAVYYLTPTEARDRHIAAGQTARLGGQIIAGSLRYDPGTRDLRFLIGDGIVTVQVIGNGAPPGLLREGAHANTSIGRWLRLYLRNVFGFVAEEHDKATFGNSARVALAEDEECLAEIGWPPLSASAPTQKLTP